MNSNKPLVIAIAAVSGGGKTTITTHLNKILPSSKALYFDDYDLDGPDDVCDWVERGADCNEWKLAPLIKDLHSLLSSSSESLDYILLDYPFGYLHSEMCKFIDFTIFIDTPLDIAMARRLLRDFKETSINHVRDDLNNYLSRGRVAYLNMLNTIKPICDLIIDGSLPRPYNRWFVTYKCDCKSSLRNIKLYKVILRRLI
jgi:uridine kinase